MRSIQRKILDHKRKRLLIAKKKLNSDIEKFKKGELKESILPIRILKNVYLRISIYYYTKKNNRLREKLGLN